MGRLLWLGLALAVPVLAACDDKTEAQRPDSGPAVVARRAAEEQLRGRLRAEGPMALRAVQAWPQQMTDRVAVCGQVNPTGAAEDPYIPWVAVVTLREGEAARTDLTLGNSGIEAGRVYLAMIDHCFEGGGPASARPLGPRALPPLPVEAPAPQVLVSTVAAGAPAPLPAVASQPVPPGPQRVVTTTSSYGVNLRDAPGGAGSTVLRTLPRASILHVFGEAPGGWLQVGEERPAGWIHASGLAR